MQSSLGRNGEDCLIKHAVELPSLALQIIILEHSIIPFSSKSILIFLLLQFLTLPPSHFLLCPLSLPTSSFGSACIPPSLPSCHPCLPSCSPLIKAGITVMIWRDAHQVLTNSSTAQVHSSPHGAHSPLLAAHWNLCWPERRAWLCTKAISTFLSLSFLFIHLLFWFIFLRTLFFLLFIWLWGDERQCIHSYSFALATHWVQSNAGHFNFAWRSLSRRSRRGDLHGHQPRVETRRVQLRSQPF